MVMVSPVMGSDDERVRSPAALKHAAATNAMDSDAAG
jgi:hypothetical protein